MAAACILGALENVSIDTPDEGGLLIGRMLSTAWVRKKQGISLEKICRPGEFYLLDHMAPIRLKGEPEIVPVYGVCRGVLFHLHPCSNNSWMAWFPKAT